MNMEIPSLEVLCAKFIGQNIHLLAFPMFKNLLLPPESMEHIRDNLNFGSSKMSPKCMLQVLANGFDEIVDTDEIDEKYWKHIVLKENSLPVKMIYPEMKKDIEQIIKTIGTSMKRIEQAVQGESNKLNNGNNDNVTFPPSSSSSVTNKPLSKYDELQILSCHIDGLKYKYGQIISSKLLLLP